MKTALIPHRAIRVLHVIDSDQRRGAEIFASELIGALDGGQVIHAVAVLRRSDGPRVSFGAPTVVLSHERSLAGGRIDPRIVWRLRRAIRRFKPDIVQGNGGNSLKYAGLAAVGTHALVVYRWIGDPSHWLADWRRRALYRVLLRRAAKVVAVGDYVRRDLCRILGLPSDRVAAIPTARDGRRFQATGDPAETRRTLDIPPHARVVLSAAALSWEKDPLGHLDVAAKVLRERSDSVYLLAGTGPLLGEVEARIRQNGLDGRVRLLGSRTDVEALLKVSDAVLIASRTESMSGVAIEAGLAGVPVAAYSMAGVPEVVVDGRTGFLAPPGDVGALAARLVQLLEDDDVRSTMGQEARRVCARFDMREVAPRYLELYEEVTGPVDL